LADKAIGGVMVDDNVVFRYRASDTPDLTSLNNELLRRARREWERAEADLRTLCNPLIAKGYRLDEIRKTISRSGLNGPLRAEVVGVVEVSRHVLAARRLWRRVSENSYAVEEERINESALGPRIQKRPRKNEESRVQFSIIRKKKRIF